MPRGRGSQPKIDEPEEGQNSVAARGQNSDAVDTDDVDTRLALT